MFHVFKRINTKKKYPQSSYKNHSDKILSTGNYILAHPDSKSAT